MYVPNVFRAEDKALAWQLIEEVRLGTLITGGASLESSLVPFMVDRERGGLGTLVGHLARANPQWRAFDPEVEVLVSFLGPNAYVSPSWYTAPRAPTWNFVAVQARGRIRLIDDAAWCREAVLRLSRTMEKPGSPFVPDDLDPAYVARLMPGIVGLEIELTRIEVQLRLSQQNGEEDRRRVHAEFARGSLRERQVAEAITRLADRAGQPAPTTT